MKNKVILVGAFHEMIELAEENGLEIAGLIDNQKAGKYRSYTILGKDADTKKLPQKIKEIHLIISPDKPSIRKKLVGDYEEMGFQFASLISKCAKISKSAVIGAGTIIQFGVNVSSECRIGMFVKLNTNCNVMHNSMIGDFTTIAPNAVILGNVKIGELCYIGANATILPNIEICDRVTIGAGAVVTKNIDMGRIFVGNPAKELLK